MRLVFMGTPAFAVPAFQALLDAGHDVVAVFTQPPRPAGRGKKTRLSPIHEAADHAGIPVFTPRRLKDAPEAFAAFADTQADAAIVVAYGNLLPDNYLSTPRLGCINVHASLLPRWRGAAPIQAALCAGDTRTGISIMQMDRGLDTGPVLATSACAITQDDTAETLHDRLATLGGTLLVETLRNAFAPVPQPQEGALYAPKLTRESGRVDWCQGAEEIQRRIRAFHPWPSCTTSYNGTILKIGGAQVTSAKSDAAPGTILDEDLTVQCGRDALRLTLLQRPGKTMMDARSFLRGMSLLPGTRFE